jgi:nicotinic acid mononucleotide adenylyltransferase
MVLSTLEAYPHFKHVVWVPTGEPPHKPELSTGSNRRRFDHFSARDRLMMVQKALQDVAKRPANSDSFCKPPFSETFTLSCPPVEEVQWQQWHQAKHWIWSQECPIEPTLFPGPHYTARTLQYWLNAQPDIKDKTGSLQPPKFQCLLSIEAIAGLPQWHALPWLLKHVTWYVCPRKGYGAWSVAYQQNLEQRLQKVLTETAPQTLYPSCHVMPVPESTLFPLPRWCATEIRQALSLYATLTPEDTLTNPSHIEAYAILKTSLPPSVWQFIQATHESLMPLHSASSLPPPTPWIPPHRIAYQEKH